MRIRLATGADWPAIWDMLRPVFRAGETYAVDRDISEPAARTLWMDAPKATYVAEEGGSLLGTCYIKVNHAGGAAHVCNCGYITAEAAQGRGIARALCTHSQEAARGLGFLAMQFNLVVSTNTGAVRLWQDMGYTIAGHLPRAFNHPRLGMVDAYVMWKAL